AWPRARLSGRWRAAVAEGRSLLRRGDQPVAHGLLARKLATAAHGFGFLARRALGWLLEEPPPFHLAEDPFALHLLLQHTQCLIDIVVADENLQFLLSLWDTSSVGSAPASGSLFSSRSAPPRSAPGAAAGTRRSRKARGSHHRRSAGPAPADKCR